MKSKWVWAILIGLSIVALGLRLPTIKWALFPPENGYFINVDEPAMWQSVERFPNNYGTDGYLYNTAVQYTIGAIVQHIPLPQGSDWSIVCWVACRVAGVLFGVAAVPLAYLLGKELGGKLTGVMAATLLSVSFMHTLNSPLAKLDVPMGTMTLVVILLTSRAFRTGHWRDFLYLGIAAGYLLGMKITGGLALVVSAVFLAVNVLSCFLVENVDHKYPIMTQAARATLTLFGVEQGSFAKLNKEQWLLRGVVVGILTFAVFVVSTPHVFLHLAEYREFMAKQKENWMGGLSHDPLTIINNWNFSLRRATVLPFVPLLAVGIVVSWRWSRNRPLLLGILALLVSFIWFWGAYIPARFILMLIPVFCVLVARPFALLVQSRARTWRLAGVTIFAVLIGWSVTAVVRGIQDYWNDPRIVATPQLLELIPKGATVTFVGADDAGQSYLYPYLSKTRNPRVTLSNRPDFVMLSGRPLSQVRKACGFEGDPNYPWPPVFFTNWYQRHTVMSQQDIEFCMRLGTDGSGYKLVRLWENRPSDDEDRIPRMELYALERPSSLETIKRRR